MLQHGTSFPLAGRGRCLTSSGEEIAAWHNVPWWLLRRLKYLMRANAWADGPDGEPSVPGRPSDPWDHILRKLR
jgi:hypothetical protein